MGNDGTGRALEAPGYQLFDLGFRSGSYYFHLSIFEVTDLAVEPEFPGFFPGCLAVKNALYFTGYKNLYGL